MKMKAYLVDDEPLAVTRLRRLLDADGRVEITGASCDPRHALEDLRLTIPDVLFLDIEMPGMSGFDLLEQLRAPHLLVVFTTAYDQYALDAFKVNSIDYLLKPVEPEQLKRAIGKLERMQCGEPRGNIDTLLKQVRAMIQNEPEHLTRVASRTGDRVEFIEVAAVSHFYAEDKLTFAATAGKDFAVDLSIAELERRLPAGRWVRIHRSTLLNVDAVKELRTWFSGKLLIKLRDGKTELQVAKERAASVKAKLGL
jgi:two-component system LytT family response regulator